MGVIVWITLFLYCIAGLICFVKDLFCSEGKQDYTLIHEISIGVVKIGYLEQN